MLCNSPYPGRGTAKRPEEDHSQITSDLQGFAGLFVFFDDWLPVALLGYEGGQHGGILRPLEVQAIISCKAAKRLPCAFNIFPPERLDEMKGKGPSPPHQSP